MNLLHDNMIEIQDHTTYLALIILLELHTARSSRISTSSASSSPMRCIALPSFEVIAADLAWPGEPGRGRELKVSEGRRCSEAKEANTAARVGGGREFTLTRTAWGEHGETDGRGGRVIRAGTRTKDSQLKRSPWPWQ